ncbi:4Fe-4S dicluster domain-containing protein [Desulfocicer niacini]
MQVTQSVNVDEIQAILRENHAQIAISLKVCAHCSLCADSCFLYTCREQKPEYMPSHKVINSLGIICKKKGRITRKELEKMQEILWERCVLCTRCYCPLGINIPNLISLGRRICRSQGISHEYNGGTGFHSPAHQR